MEQRNQPARGAGDTRPYTITSLVPSTGGNQPAKIDYANHFYPATAGSATPSRPGAATATTGTAYTSAWKFNHNESKMKGLCKNWHPPCPD